MTKKKSIRITDPEASDHDFPFKLRDRLRVDDDGNVGTVEDAVWEGEVPHGFYKIHYTIKREDGQILNLELDEILKFNRVNRESR